MNWDNYVILLGGSLLQKPIADEIKARGYDLLIIDRDDNCYLKEQCNYFIRESIYDADNCIKAVDSIVKRHKKPKAILTDAADVGIVVSKLCEYFGLHATPSKIAEKINIKSNLHLIMEPPLDMPLFKIAKNKWCVEAYLDWSKYCDNNEVRAFPCVIKPSSNCGSRGVSLVNNINEFEEAYQLAISLSKNNEDIVIEQYLEGEEISTDWYVKDGIPLYANGAHRVFDNKFGHELGHINPVYPIPYEVRDIVQELVIVTGYTEGPLKADFINDKKRGWQLIEAATRWSGGFDHGFSAKLSTGRNLEQPLLDFALSGNASFDEFKPSNQGYFACFGTICNGAIQYDLEKRISEKYALNQGFALISKVHGEVVDDVPTNRNVWLFAYGNTKEEAWNIVLLMVTDVKRLSRE